MDRELTPEREQWKSEMVRKVFSVWVLGKFLKSNHTSYDEMLLYLYQTCTLKSTKHYEGNFKPEQVATYTTLFTVIKMAIVP